MQIRFADPQQQIVLPLDGICRFAIDCPACASGSRCTGYDLGVKKTGAPLQVEIYSVDGRRVARNLSSSAAKRLRFGARRDERYVMVLRPGKGAKPDADLELTLQMK